jgi:translation initiation factor eIF-2B subunit delta
MSEDNEKKPDLKGPKSSKDSKDVKESTQQQSQTTDERQLSNKELKELKKREKAAKRAAAKAASGDTETTESTTQQQQQQQQKGKQSSLNKEKTPKTISHIKKQLNNAKIHDPTLKTPPMFGHLETREERISSTPKIASIVHPSILSLTLKISTYKIVGSSARCIAMMRAFKDVIISYKTPEGTSLQRHLTGHLSHQIEYLKTGRPLSISMGNAIRWLKQKISIIEINTSEEKCKDLLINDIELFIMEKIVVADKVIIDYAENHILNNSKILTYGHSNVLSELFEYCANEQNKKFEIYIIDSKPLFEGKKLAKKLSKFENIKLHYNLINSLSSVLEKSNIDFCFLGAHSMLSNGRLYSRVGTALIAMASKNKSIPVLVCCESLKFSDKVQLDSVTLNELGDSDDLINTKPFNKTGFNLQQYMNKLNNKLLTEKESDKGKKNNNNNNSNSNKQKEIQQSKLDDEYDLSNWKQYPSLNILNILYDLTPPEYIQKIITEFGALPPSSVPVILREYKSST